MPKDVNNETGINSARGGISKREMQLNRGEDGELNYQERVAMIWIEKVKSMGSCTLYRVEGRRGSAEDRVILADMSNVGMFKGVNKTVGKSPVKVVNSDIRTLGNRDSNWRRVVRVIRHTLGRRDSC